jgi:hypothetical protein
MNWKRYDKFLYGTLAGLITPMVMFVLYWLFFHHQLDFPVRFVKYLMGGNLLSNVIKICTLFNLLVFYIGLSKKMDLFCRGIILSIFLYIALIAYITYYHEAEYI